jgi:uncharacterized protein
MKHALNWFEIPVSDFARAKKFYEAIIGAAFYEMKMGEFTMGFFPCDQGTIGGAIVHGIDYEPSDRGTLVYLNGGEDLAVILARVIPAGGSIVEPKRLITPEIGYFALFKDTEGNRVALHSMR